MNMSCLLGIVATAAVWLGPTPAIGYLARVGPAPLRFQAPPKAPEEIVPLPPLAMKDPDPEPPQMFGPPPPPVDWEAPSEETIHAQPQVVVAPQVVPVPIDPAATLTPQMFLQFFNEHRGTNGDFSISVPYQFSPPPVMTIPPPPSRATYTKN